MSSTTADQAHERALLTVALLVAGVIVIVVAAGVGLLGALALIAYTWKSTP